MLYQASAAGSLMLFGEYAVVTGAPALVCAIDRRITVSIKERQDERIIIRSALGGTETTVSNCEIISPHTMVLASILQLKEQLRHGFEIDITAAFSHQLGLGSSAAVTVACLAALHDMLGAPYTAQSLWHCGMDVIQLTQGSGSGADLAASITGGVILFEKEPLKMQQITKSIPLTVIYSGTKASTVNALKKQNEQGKTLQTNQAGITTLVQQASHAITNEKYEMLLKPTQQAQSYLVQRGVSTDVLNAIVDDLNAQATLYGAKISGAGYGDCAIAFGHTNEAEAELLTQSAAMGARKLSIACSHLGVQSCRSA